MASLRGLIGEGTEPVGQLIVATGADTAVAPDLSRDAPRRLAMMTGIAPMVPTSAGPPATSATRARPSIAACRSDRYRLETLEDRPSAPLDDVDRHGRSTNSARSPNPAPIPALGQDKLGSCCAGRASACRCR